MPLKAWVAERVADIAGAWRSFDVASQSGLYSRELVAMEERFGRARVELALQSLIRNGVRDGEGRRSGFAPEPDLLWAEVKATADPSNSRGLARTDPKCEFCSGSGWENARGGTQVKICRCRRPGRTVELGEDRKTLAAN